MLHRADENVALAEGGRAKVEGKRKVERFIDIINPKGMPIGGLICIYNCMSQGCKGEAT